MDRCIWEEEDPVIWWIAKGHISIWLSYRDQLQFGSSHNGNLDSKISWSAVCGLWLQIYFFWNVQNLNSNVEFRMMRMRCHKVERPFFLRNRNNRYSALPMLESVSNCVFYCWWFWWYQKCMKLTLCGFIMYSSINCSLRISNFKRDIFKLRTGNTISRYLE